MFGEPTSGSRRLRQDKEGRKGGSVPAELLPCDGDRDAVSHAQLPKCDLDGRQLALHLDRHQRASHGVPGKDVDGTAFAEQCERHFDADLPTRASEDASHALDEVGVSFVEEAIKHPAAPLNVQHEARIERGDHASQRWQADSFQMAPLDPRDDRLRDTGGSREILLAPAKPASQRPNAARFVGRP